MNEPNPFQKTEARPHGSGLLALVLLTAWLASVTTLLADNPPIYLFQWGSHGSGNSQFQGPVGIAVDISNNVMVADVDNSRVETFDHYGNYITQWGISYPYGIARDSSNSVYVTDSGNESIEKFDGNGNFLTRWGSYGGGNGQFSSPSGIAIDNSNNVYVADYGNYRVEKFDSNGNYLTQWGSEGSSNGQFQAPVGIAIDSSNNVYVTDNYPDNRIEKFDSSGNYLAQWGSSGSGNGQFDDPEGIAIDSSNNVYVADTENSRVEKFDSNGNYLTQWGSNGAAPGQFSYPGGIALNGSGNLIYVVDSGNNRIQAFVNNSNTIPPYITGQPASQNILVGYSVTFDVAVVGGVPLAYQWTSNNVALLNATNSTLTLAHATLSATYAVVVSNSFGTALSSNAFLTVVPAIVTTLPASGITNIGAQLNGSTILGSDESVVWFDWGTDTNYGNITGTSVLPGNNGTNLTSTALTGLPGDYYHYRLDAANDYGIVYGNDEAFTVGFAPAATTLLPLNQAGGVTLNATVNAEGWDTTAYFKWGRSGYVTNVTPSLNVGAGATPVNVSDFIRISTQFVSYSVQIVASNHLGIVSGQIVSFEPPFVNVPTNNWQSVACSADATVMIAVVNLLYGSTYGPVYISTNSGATWSQATNAPHVGWQTVACSADGRKIIAGVGGGFGSLVGPIYTSPDGGATWVSNNVPRMSWESVVSSADGTKLAAAAQGAVYTSTNAGAVWAKATNLPNLSWEAIASSADGSKLAAGAWGTATTNIFTSTNFGAAWTTNHVPGNLSVGVLRGWISIASSADGNDLLAAGGGDGANGELFISTNSGAEWTVTATNISPLGLHPWIWVASSADGSKLAALANSVSVGNPLNSIWTSKNSGKTWVSNNVPSETWTSVALSADGESLLATIGWPTTSSYMYITQRIPSPVLTLAPADANGNLGLSWLTPSLDFTLQQSPDLINWSDTTNLPVLNLTNLQQQLIVPPSGENSYFRLASP